MPERKMYENMHGESLAAGVDSQTARQRLGLLRCSGILDSITLAAEDILGEALTGVYLHGSLAMGCFNPEKSDIDLILVIDRDVTDQQKRQFMETVVEL